MMLHKYIPRPYNKTPKRNNLVNPFYLNIDLHSHILISISCVKLKSKFLDSNIVFNNGSVQILMQTKFGE